MNAGIKKRVVTNQTEAVHYYETMARIVSIVRAPPFSAFAAFHCNEHALRSSHFRLNLICVVFDLFSASLPCMCKKKKKKLTVCLYFSQLSYGAQKEQSLGTYLA